jgi:uncharacterized protein (DUF433 family)
MNHEIINRGRGPEIQGTRITIYDVMDYSCEGMHHSGIAVMLGLSSRQVLAALQYIEEHKEEVQQNYQKILDRPRIHSPEVQAKLDAIQAKYREQFADRKRQHPMPELDAEEPGAD